LRHEIGVLQRQLGGARVRFTPADRALLAALLHRLPRQTLRGFRLLVRPGTVLRWHRELLARRHAVALRPKRPGRPRTVRSIRVLVLRLAKENPSWGYRRIHGEFLVLGVKVAASTVWQILTDASIDRPPNTPPAPGHSSSAPRQTSCWPATSSKPSHSPAHGCTCSQRSNTLTAEFEYSVRHHIRPRPG
jgi:hypothetical protein